MLEGTCFIIASLAQVETGTRRCVLFPEQCHRLVGGETALAPHAFAAAADGVVFAVARVNDLAFLVAAVGTSHERTTLFHHIFANIIPELGASVQ